MTTKRLTMNRYRVVKKVHLTYEIEVEAVSAAAAESIANDDISTEPWANADPQEEWEEIVCIEKVK